MTKLTACRLPEGEALVALSDTVCIMLEIMPAVRWGTVNQVSWAVPAVVSLGVTDHFSDHPCFSEQQVCDTTGQIL